MPWDEPGGCLQVLARWVSGAEVARVRFRRWCGTWEPLARWVRPCVDAVGVRENPKQLICEGESTDAGSGADRLVVAGKVL